MTNNILNCIYISLHLQLLVKLYKQFLNYFNIIYFIAKIKKLIYKKFNVLFY